MACRAKRLQLGHRGEETGRRGRSKAGNGRQEFLLAGKARMAGNMRPYLLFDSVYLGLNRDE
jgi:hypothetical protein